MINRLSRRISSNQTITPGFVETITYIVAQNASCYNKSCYITLIDNIQTISESALDGDWYSRLMPLAQALGETFEVLMPPLDRLEADYKKFAASGYSTVPNLYPAVNNIELFQKVSRNLLDLKQKIENTNSSPRIRKLYVDKVDELIANCAMVLAAHNKDAVTFRSTNKFIYGTPDRDIFAAACAWIRSDAEKLNQKSSSLRDICRDVLDQVPDMGGDRRILSPDEDTFKTIRALHMRAGGFVDQLFGTVPVDSNAPITAAEGDGFVKAAITNVGSDFDLKVSPNGLWSVLQSQRQVVRPETYSLLRPAFMGIVAHEVGSHLLESTNGAKSRLRLLELGLDRYELGNEGRAFLREQIMYETFDDYVSQKEWYPAKASWEYRVAIHVVISLAVGLGRRAYAFPELYSLVAALYRYWTVARGRRVNELAINQGAWNLVVRALKGTSGHGGAYMKDIVYLEGNIRCWQAAEQHPEIILYGDKGKFDVANREHVMMLTELGVLPEKLDKT